MKYRLCYDVLGEPIDGDDENLGEILADLGEVHNGYCFVGLIGPDGEPPWLRFGVNDEAGLGFVHWLPTWGWAFPRGVPEPDRTSSESWLKFISGEHEIVKLSPSLCGVPADAVRDAVREYVRTGGRPTNVAWYGES